MRAAKRALALDPDDDKARADLENARRRLRELVDEHKLPRMPWREQVAWSDGARDGHGPSVNPGYGAQPPRKRPPAPSAKERILPQFPHDEWPRTAPRLTRQAWYHIMWGELEANGRHSGLGGHIREANLRRGGKTVFPRSWSDGQIRAAMLAALAQDPPNAPKYTSIGEYESVTLKITTILKRGTRSVSTAFPTQGPGVLRWNSKMNHWEETR